MAEMRKARAMRAELEAMEIRDEVSTTDHTRFNRWVDSYLHSRFGESPKTLSRYLGAWRTFEEFLDTHKIFYPRAVTRELAYRYLKWRAEGGHQNSRGKGKPIHHNTILQEIKIFGLIMQEAVNRRWMEYNPIRGLGIKRVPPREKAEMTDEHVRIIRQEIAKLADTQHKHFLSTSLEIALHQACRLQETRFALADVDFVNSRLKLMVKGRQIHYAALNPKLIPLLEKLKAQGRTTTWDCKMPGLTWSKFIAAIRTKYPGFENVSFHSTRVRGISLLERAGVPEHLVMARVRHASTTVHRIYRRVKPEELSPFWTALDTHGSREMRVRLQPPENRSRGGPVAVGKPKPHLLHGLKRRARDVSPLRRFHPEHRNIHLIHV